MPRGGSTTRRLAGMATTATAGAAPSSLAQRRALAGSLLAGRLVGVDVLVDTARAVDLGGVDLEEACGRGAHHVGRAAHVGDLVDRLAARQAVGDLDDGTLGVAVQQQVGLAVHQHRAAHLVLPVVVVGDAAQAGLDAAQHDRHLGIGLAAALRIDQRGTVRPLAGHVAGGIGIVAAQPAVGGVAVDHRIHVAGGDAEEQIRLAQRLEGLGALPVGLGDDADAETLRLEHAADDGHAEAGVVDIGVAADDDDVAAVPAQRLHLAAAHRQEGRRAEALGPIGAVAGQGLGGGRGDGGCSCGGGHGRWGGRTCTDWAATDCPSLAAPALDAFAQARLQARNRMCIGIECTQCAETASLLASSLPSQLKET